MTIEEIKQKIIPIAKEYGIPKVAIFGSVAKGLVTVNSDIDILIEKGDKIRDLWDLSDFSDKIEKSLQKSVDVITYTGLKNSVMAGSILAGEIIIYEA